MKKQDKKRLVLAKEQVRTLRNDLELVVGGQPTLSTRCGGDPSDCCSNRIMCTST